MSSSSRSSAADGGSFATIQFAVSNYHGPTLVDVLGGVADYSGSLVLQMPLSCVTRVVIEERGEPGLTAAQRIVVAEDAPDAAPEPPTAVLVESLRLTGQGIEGQLSNEDPGGCKLSLRFAARSCAPASASPEDFSAYVRSEADAFAKFAREAGIKAE